jgi:hypothetical protein
MPQFPSPEWIDAFCDELAGQPGAAEAARVLDGVYRFVIEPDGPLDQRHAYDLEIRPAPGDRNGDRPAVARLAAPAGEPRLTLNARYGRWRQMIRGELDIVMAVMLRRLRVSGSLDPLRHANTKPLLRALRSVETTWPDS